MSNDAMRDAFEWLETEISAVDCMYRGDPSYEHDAHWMRDRALKLISEAFSIFVPLAAPAQSEAKPVYPVYQTNCGDAGWEDVDVAEYEEWAYKKRILYTAPSAAPAQSVDGYKDLYVALHKTLGPAIDYVQSHQSEFGIGLGEDTIPHIVKAFLDSRAPAGNGGNALTDEEIMGYTLMYDLPYGPRSRQFARQIESHLATRHAPTGADALEGWKFKKGHGQYWMVLAPNSCFALARDADDERSSSRILAQLAAVLAKRGRADALTDATALADAIIQQMSELCDRSSPNDEPDAMIANASEMHGCVERAIASILVKRGEAS